MDGKDLIETGRRFFLILAEIQLWRLGIFLKFGGNLILGIVPEFANSAKFP